MDEHNFNQSDAAYLLHSLIEWALNEPAWTVNWQPLPPAKVRAEIAAYRSYARNFNRDQAARRPLAYVVVNNYAPVNLTNLARWHTLDAGEQIGSFTIYQVRLKP